MQTLIYNAKLILPDTVLERGWLLIEDERIAALGEGDGPTNRIETNYRDAQGDIVMPGIIDLHCDAIEQAVEPRPKVFVDVYTALNETDWRLAGNGITTEYHAISLDDDELGVRSDTFGTSFCRALQENTSRLIRHKLHARFELSSDNAFKAIARMIERKEVDMVSLMDHSPGQGQFRSVEAYRDYIMRSSNRNYDEVTELIARKSTLTTTIAQNVESMARLACAAGLPLATHDDDTAAKVAQWPALGVSISEFPTTLEAARKAHELGLTVCMGAPNVLRGQSSSGNLSATTALQAGVVDALCADYYPYAMLGAVFLLTKQEILTLPQAARLVTLNPAKAIGLGDELGSLEVGKIADVIQVRVGQQGTAEVQRVIVGGEERVVRY